MPLTYLKRRFFVTLLIFRYQSFTRCLRKHVLFKFLFVWRADWIDRRKVSVLNLDYNFKRISQLIRLNCVTFNKCIDAYLTRFQPQGTGGFKKKSLFGRTNTSNSQFIKIIMPFVRVWYINWLCIIIIFSILKPL